MRLATVYVDKKEQLVICRKNGWIPIADLNQAFESQWPETMEKMLTTGQLTRLNTWYRKAGSNALDPMGHLFLTAQPDRYAPLYRHPPKIWGIGLNYSAHANDLSERAPTSLPASFMKPNTAIIGPGESIRIPMLSEKTTAEAELGIIIGRRCKDVPQEKWLDVVAGFTTILDMTAEDILRQNPRYLTMSKSFDTFFSFGPQLVTPDEIDDVMHLKVSTVINGCVHAENTVDHMTFPPDVLIAYHSTVMTLLPGDILSTGTPGSVQIRHGDRMTCRISGFESLHNPVVDLKQS
jgi:2-keto-4-pentenoate hydratase/2-oxohepta-3-ene-1,7-dioic acid hydratase in catechol pathway